MQEGLEPPVEAGQQMQDSQADKDNKQQGWVGAAQPAQAHQEQGQAQEVEQQGQDQEVEQQESLPEGLSPRMVEGQQSEQS